MRLRRPILVLAFAALPAGQFANAASFDCAKAISAREHLICGAPYLSKMDQDLGSLYAEALASLSPAGAASLRASERAWFRYTDEVCGLRSNTKPMANGGQTPGFCLARAYEERIVDIRQAGRHGRYVFTRVDTYDVQRASDDEGLVSEGLNFNIHHVGYPQIDAATAPVLGAWNKKAAADGTANADGKTGEYDETDGSYEVGLATKDLISLRWTISFYNLDAAHREYGSSAWNVMLAFPLRNVTPDDLFRKNSDWRGRLEDIARAAIKDDGKGGELQERYVRGVVDHPEAWFLRPEGLDVSLSAYDGGCYMCAPGSGLVPWAKLAPFLKTKLVP